MPPRLELENFSPQSNPSTQNLDSLSLYSELRYVMQKQPQPPAENLPQITISQTDNPALTTAEILGERESVAKTLRKYMDRMDLPGLDSKIKDGVLSKEELMTFLFLSDKSKNLSDSERKDLMSALNQFGWIANANFDPNLPFQMTTISKGDIDRWLTQMPCN